MEEENELEKEFKDSQIRLDKSVIEDFYPYLLKGLEHFYGKENMPLITTRLSRVIYFQYFYNSKDLDTEFKIEFEKFIKNLGKKVGTIDKDLEDLLKETYTKNIFDYQIQSGVSTVEDDLGISYQIMLIEMSSNLFYPRLIHEYIHCIDTIAKDGEKLSGFEIDNKGEIDGKLFNEYFTDKIAIDIYNYLIETECPLLKGKTKIERNFGNSGEYYIPNVFLKEFYEKYKKEICDCKLRNSNEIFVKAIGEEETQKIKEYCEVLPALMAFNASDEDYDKAISIRDECKKMIKKGMKNNYNKR
jgi:hypothetical protein